MIRVIEDNRERYKVTCGYCHSVLEYTEDEIQQIDTTKTRTNKQFGFFAWQKEVEHYILCPLCKHRITLSVDWENVHSEN